MKDFAEFLFYFLFFALLYLKPKWEKFLKKRRINLGKSSEVIEAIDQNCYYLLGLLGAKRVSVWQFGNGDESFSGFSYKHGSMIGEAVQPDQKALRNESQKIPIYDYVPVLKDLKNTEGTLFQYSKFTYNNTNMFYKLTSLHIHTCIEAKLNPTNIDEGILSISFGREKSFTKEELDEVSRIAFEIYKLIKNG